MREVLANRQVRAYLFAQVLSVFGDTTLWLATGIWVKQLTGSSSAAGMVFFFYLLPYLFSPFAGVVVDRVRRRPLLVWVNLASAVVVLALLAVGGRGSLWLIYTVIFLYGVSGTLVGAAQSALLTTMLPSSLLADANGIMQTGREALRLVAPLLGAGVVAWIGTAKPIAVFDAATFVVAAIVLIRLKLTERRPQREPVGWWNEVSAGARHVFATDALRHIMVAAAVTLLVIGFGETIIFPIAQRGLHQPATFVGVLMAINGIGAVAGGLTGARAVRRLGDGAVIGVGLLGMAVGNALEITPNLVVVVVGLIIVGAAIPWVVIAFNTAVQTRTPAHLQGRAFTAADMIATVPQTLSVAAGAALIAVVDYRLLLAIMSVAIAASGLMLLCRRFDWRAVPDFSAGAHASGSAADLVQPGLVAGAVPSRAVGPDDGEHDLGLVSDVTQADHVAEFVQQQRSDRASRADAAS